MTPIRARESVHVDRRGPSAGTARRSPEQANGNPAWLALDSSFKPTLKGAQGPPMVSQTFLYSRNYMAQAGRCLNK